MTEKKFNLLDEKWIQVITLEGKTETVSFREIFFRAQEIRRLACEMPTVDIAILRVLLAVVVTVFYRYDAEGEMDELTKDNAEPEDVLERWQAYYDNACFNEKVFGDYLEEYRERFWLVHPAMPFYQVPEMKYGTEYGVLCLVGNVKESNNKATRHHFSMSEPTEIDFAAASRWLIFLNGYAINIKKDSKAPGTEEPVGTGRLGRMGLIYVEGDNLFDTLMLNMMPLRDGVNIWGRPKPAWESELRTDQAHKIPQPDNLPELYTIQSRRICLTERDNAIVGFHAIGGDYCSLEDAFQEQMTLWRKTLDKKAGKEEYKPKIFRKAVQIWREFPNIFYAGQSDRIPGIVLWMQRLYDEEMLEKNRPLIFASVGFNYGDKNYIYGDCFGDVLSLSSDFLGKIGSVWQQLVSDEIEKCRKVSDEIFLFAGDQLSRLIYGTDDRKRVIQAKLSMEYYSRINTDFRHWLMDIRPSESEKEEMISRWEKISCNTAGKVVEMYMDSFGTKIFDIREEKGMVYAIPLIMRRVRKKLIDLYPEEK